MIFLKRYRIFQHSVKIIRDDFKGTQIFERIFEKILEEAINSGYVDASAVFIDGTHVKASANKKKNRKVEIEATAKAYQEQLDEETEKTAKHMGKGR